MTKIRKEVLKIMLFSYLHNAFFLQTKFLKCIHKKRPCDSITPCIAVTARLGMIGAQLFFLTRFVSKVTKVLEPFFFNRPKRL